MTKPESILVVDDDEDTRFVVSMALEGSGFAVTQASNGAEALEAVHTSPPGLVLLDLMMPVMSGAEFLERLQSEGKYADLPILVLTGWPEQAAGLRGTHGIVKKPLDLDELVSLAEKTLRSDRMPEERSEH